MIKRTDREHVLQTLSDNPQWNVIDLGCGANAGCEYANVLVDHDDHTDKYPNKKFVKHELNSYPYPFEDKEFDIPLANLLVLGFRFCDLFLDLFFFAYPFFLEKDFLLFLITLDNFININKYYLFFSFNIL